MVAQLVEPLEISVGLGVLKLVDLLGQADHELGELIVQVGVIVASGVDGYLLGVHRGVVSADRDRS